MLQMKLKLKLKFFKDIGVEAIWKLINILLIPNFILYIKLQINSTKKISRALKTFVSSLDYFALHMRSSSAV